MTIIIINEVLGLFSSTDIIDSVVTKVAENTTY